MRQFIEERHCADERGNPAGGETKGIGIDIKWQDGPLGRGETRREPNGAFVEGVLAAALGRLEYYQRTQFSCRENACAITKIEEALHWLESRTAKRERLGIEGTHATEGRLAVDRDYGAKMGAEAKVSKRPL